MKNKGFTLIELMIAVAIIAALAAMLMPQLGKISIRGKDVQRQSDLKKIQVIVEQYKADWGNYPSTLIADQSITSPTGSKVYLGKVPKDPEPANPQYLYRAFPLNCNNGTSPPTVYCTTYCLFAKLNDATGASQAVGCTNSDYNLSVRPN